MPAVDDASGDLKLRLDDALARDGRSGASEVLIAGGGIGGLAAALALARRGIASHILERRSTFSEEGAGIQIGPNGTRILRELGVAEALRPHAGVPQWLRVHEAARGRELTMMPLNPDMEKRFGAPYWAVHREDLHAALLTMARADPKIRVTMDAGVELAADNELAAAAVTRDGNCYVGAAVICADGLRSQLREIVSGPQHLRPVGKSAFRAVVAAADVEPDLAQGGTRIWLAPNAHVVHYAVRAGTEIAIVVIVDDAFSGEGWSHDADPALYLARLDLAPPLRDLLNAPRAWRRWALAERDAHPRMARGRIALLGDAAHPVMPFLAQGGVLALEDAVVLADVLASGEHDVAGALELYHRQRSARAQRVRDASRRNGRIYHLGGMAARARNAVLRLVPGERLIAGYDWIYGWTRGSQT